MQLPSNTEDVKGANTMSHFICDLPIHKKLAGDWLVALSEITFPINWYNVKQDTQMIFLIESEKVVISRGGSGKDFNFLLKLKDKDPTFQYGTRIKFKLSAGYYAPDVLLERINLGLSEATGNQLCPLLITYNVQQSRFNFEIREGNKSKCAVYFETNEDEMAAILGIVPTWREESTNVFVLPSSAPSTSFLMNQTPSLFIYTNIIDYQIVGNKLCPLLRTVPVIGKYGQICNLAFQNKLWARVNKGYINSVEIEITDDLGNRIQFQGGRVDIVLQFKKQNFI